MNLSKSMVSEIRCREKQSYSRFPSLMIGGEEQALPSIHWQQQEF